MITQWLKQDIERCFEHHATRIVITDAKSDGDFLRALIPSEYPVILADNDQAEADAKYQAEHQYQGLPVIFYTHRPKNELGLLYEYVKTGGCIVLDDIETYIKDHIFHDLRLNVQMPKKQLILAAKLSVDKDKKWWEGVCNGTIAPLDIKEETLKLLLNPDEVYQRMDADTWDLFREEICTLLSLPKTPQTPATFASQIYEAIFSALLKNKVSKELQAIYFDLVDNEQYRDSLGKAINRFEIPKDINVLSIYPDHCFREIDERFMRYLSQAIANNKNLFDFKHALNNRLSASHASSFKASWLGDLKTLLDCPEPIVIADDVNMFANYYLCNFASLDTAMRHLYAAWLNEERILRPLQEKYEAINKIVQEKWNGFFRRYESNQYSIIPSFFMEQRERSAAIVCDGLRLEMALEVVKMIRQRTFHVSIDQATKFSVLPSITENGMSALYGSHEIVTIAAKRHEILRKYVDDVTVKQLDMLSPAETAEHLVLTFGDIDQVCEKKQLAGLKDIDHYGEILRDTILTLLQMGYRHVLLTADHGFVITGILDEADKNPKPQASDVKVEERFALSNDPALEGKYLIRKQPYAGYEAQYYPKNDKPFVTKGAYGYAHGGFTPQECIIPAFVFTEPQATPELAVRIVGKNDLKNIVGNVFKIKVMAQGDSNSMFEQERKVSICLYDAAGNTPFALKKTFKNGTQDEFEVDYPGGECRLIIADVTTGFQLDSCEVRQSNQRNLNGIF